MKKLTTAIVLSMSGLIASTAMAAPNDHDHHDNYRNHDVRPVKVIHKDDRANIWREGQVVPHEYQHPRYVIDYRTHDKYVLVNEQSHKIIKVIR